MTLTLKQRQEREKRVRELIEKGCTIAEIADDVGTTPQSVHEFMRRRGWRTKNAEQT